MNRFLLFFGDNYYPNGGWHDYHDSFTTVEEAQAKAQEILVDYSWAHIVDTQNPDAEPISVVAKEGEL